MISAYISNAAKMAKAESKRLALPVCARPYLTIWSHVEFVIVLTAKQARSSKAAPYLKALKQAR